MDALATTTPETLCDGRAEFADDELLAALAAYPLECVATEFPHYQHAVESPDDTVEPCEDHPVFFGCFDWHSAVHSHWCLIRQLRLFEDHPRREEIVTSIDARFTPEKMAAEVEHVEANPTFEKPYGWAWLLGLAAELHLWDGERADAWAGCLEPLESAVVSLVESEFLSQDRPFRVGTHDNTAFALTAVHDYAVTTGEQSLASAVEETARGFYAEDTDYPVAYEPMGWDFLSPALTEADLMRRVLDRSAFVEWTEAFFPDLTETPHDGILDPVAVAPDPEEGVALHLVGTNLSKAWCLAGLSETLAGHRYGDLFAESAHRHADVGVERAFTDDYAGSHWLSSFVVYLLTRAEGGIAPRG